MRKVAATTGPFTTLTNEINGIVVRWQKYHAEVMMRRAALEAEYGAKVRIVDDGPAPSHPHELRAAAIRLSRLHAEKAEQPEHPNGAEHANAAQGWQVVAAAATSGQHDYLTIEPLIHASEVLTKLAIGAYGGRTNG